MTAWATAFLIVALVSATLGFGGVPGLAVSIARIIFVVALTASVTAWLISALRRGARRRDALTVRAEREE